MLNRDVKPSNFAVGRTPQVSFSHDDDDQHLGHDDDDDGEEEEEEDNDDESVVVRNAKSAALCD